MSAKVVGRANADTLPVPAVYTSESLAVAERMGDAYVQALCPEQRAKAVEEQTKGCPFVLAPTRAALRRSRRFSRAFRAGAMCVLNGAPGLPMLAPDPFVSDGDKVFHAATASASKAEAAGGNIHSYCNYKGDPREATGLSGGCMAADTTLQAECLVPPLRSRLQSDPRETSSFSGECMALDTHPVGDSCTSFCNTTDLFKDASQDFTLPRHRSSGDTFAAVERMACHARANILVADVNERCLSVPETAVHTRLRCGETALELQSTSKKGVVDGSKVSVADKIATEEAAVRASGVVGACRASNPLDAAYEIVAELSALHDGGWVCATDIAAMADHEGLPIGIVLECVDSWVCLGIMCYNQDRSHVKFIVPCSKEDQ